MAAVLLPEGLSKWDQGLDLTLEPAVLQALLPASKAAVRAARREA